MEDKALYGGEKYKRIAASIGALVAAKNAAYGDSFHECAEFLCLLYPQGVHPGQYQNLLAIVRVWDKLKRIATNQDPYGENPWQDIAGYSILMCKDPDPEAGFTAADYNDSKTNADHEWEESCQDRGFTAPGDVVPKPLFLKKDTHRNAAGERRTF